MFSGFILRSREIVGLLHRRRWLGALARIFHTEWNEAPRMFPHCCTQAGCWAHKDEYRCNCRCIWCRIARLTRQDEPDWKRAEMHPGHKPGLVVAIKFEPDDAEKVLKAAEAEGVDAIEYVRRRALEGK